jgi:auxin efflux family transporter
MSLISWPDLGAVPLRDTTEMGSWMSNPFLVNMISPDSMTILKGDRHPSFAHLIILVLAAVLEVVCVSLPGYIIARQGMFDAESQKFLANLNVMLFTPCLSMCSTSYRRGASLTSHSIYQNCVTIDSREAPRIGNNTPHIYYPNICFLRGRHRYFEAV